MKDQIELSITVRGTAAEIWRALTDSDDIENWWSDEVVLEPRVGGKFQEAWEDDEGNKGLATGKVLSLQAKKNITFTWREKVWPKEAQTECTFTIEDEGSKRILTVKHVGWGSLPEKSRVQIMKDFQVGWDYHLKELKSYLDD